MSLQHLPLQEFTRGHILHHANSDHPAATLTVSLLGILRTVRIVGILNLQA